MFCPNVSCESDNFVKLPYGDNWFVCGDCLTRWDFDPKSDTWTRNFWAEAEWAKMASYVDKTYQEAVATEVEYARSKSKKLPKAVAAK